MNFRFPRGHILLIIVLCTYAPLLITRAAPLLGWNLWVLAGYEIFVFLPLALIAGTILFSIIFALIPKLRQKALPTFITALILALLFFPAIWASGKLRMTVFRVAADRAKPLVTAIDQYSRDNGSPPTSLDMLVPKYILEIPVNLPELELETNFGKSGQTKCGNPWILRADAGSGTINWDEFLYFPKQNYEDPECDLVGCGITKLGEWAYCHE